MIQARRRAKFRTFIFPLLILVGTLIMGVGYASVSDVALNIDGSVMARAYHDTFISDFSIVQNSDSDILNASSLKNVYGTTFNANVFLEESMDSTVTFKLTLCNATKSVFTYMGVNYDDFFYSNPDIEVSVQGLEVGDKFLGKSNIDVYLTFSYVDDLEEITSMSLDGYLNLVFEMFPPEFSVIGNPVNWVNTDATLEVVPTDNVPVDFFEYSFDGGENWSTNNKNTYTENTDNINILIRDYEGVVSNPYTTAVTRIDKVPPVITLLADINNTIVHLWDDYNIKGFISVDDNASGINENEYYITFNDQVVTSTTCFPTAGYYTLVVHLKDIAGNYTSLNWPILVRWPTGGKYILANYPVISSGDGLYADTVDTGLNASLPYTSKYYYAGKVVNNYMTFSGNSSWRVVGIPQTEGIKVVGGDVGSYRYFKDGWLVNNNFFDSKTTLRSNLESWASSGSIGNGGINMANYLNYVDNATWFVGNARGDSSFSDLITRERENSSMTDGKTPVWTNKVGLLNVTDYIKMSNGFNFSTIENWDSNSYKNTSWFLPSNSWTLNADDEGTDNDYWYYNGNNDKLQRNGAYANKYGVKPVVYLKNDVIISGLGTQECPFYVHDYNDWGWFDNAAKTGGDLNFCNS